MIQISDKISAIEKELDLKSFNYQGENIWPVIRLGIYLSSTKTTSASSFSYGNAIRFFAAGAFRHFFNSLKNLARRESLDTVIVTTSHYKVTEGEKVFDRIIDPVLNYLQRRNKKFSVWEFTARYRYDANISYKTSMRPLQQELYFLSFLKKFNPFSKRYTLEGEVQKLNALLARHEINFKVDGSMVRKLETIFRQAEYFQKNLKGQRVKKVFVVCYYDIKCFSMLLAAHRLGIPTIDLQHGVQGQNHMAYARWPEEVFRNTPFLPTHFFVWDANSKKIIETWKPDVRNILLGCNKWFLDRAKKISDELILLTLQPIDDFLPAYVIDIMKRYQGDKRWAVRLHPRQLADIGKVESILADAGLSEKTDVRNASHVPLTSLLERTVLHVTYYSSVAIEASYYGTPTYFLGEEYLIHYTSYLDSELIYYYPKHDLNSVISAIEKDGVAGSHKGEDRINVLDQFIDGQ